MVEKGRFVDEPYGFAYDCGFPVEVTGVASGNFRLREGTGDDATAFFSLDRLSYREIHTNPQTGEWFSVSGHFANNEVGAPPASRARCSSSRSSRPARSP